MTLNLFGLGRDRLFTVYIFLKKPYFPICHKNCVLIKAQAF